MINLLPPEYKEEITYGRKNRRTLSWVTTVAFGIISLMIVTTVGRGAIISAKNQAVTQKNLIEEQISQTKLTDVEKEYSAFVSTTANVKKIYSQEVLYSRLIRKLATLLPPDAKITNISLTDKDKALNLNFINAKDNLGPVILVNLLNQGEQISAKSQSLITDAFSLPLGYSTVKNKNGQYEVRAAVDPKLKQLEYFIEVSDTKSEQDSLTSLKNALKNGGELSYELVKKSITDNNLMSDVAPPNVPRFISYTINTQNRSVDFAFRANSLEDVNNITGLFNDNKFGALIETYSFENKTYSFNDKCMDSKRKKTCEVICKDTTTTCTDDQKICKPLIDKGCNYIIRGYYDELYSSATITTTSQAEKETCLSTRQKPCTHKIVAKYNQLFDKVDINKTSACSTDTAGTLKCPVDLRAQFNTNAKFYFLNTEGATP